MAQYVSTRNLKFLLHEVLKTTELNQYNYYQDYDEESINMAIDAAKQLSDQYLYPIYTEMDRDKATIKDGIVYTHPGLEKAIKAIGEGGWISAHSPYEVNGQQMPLAVLNAALFIMYAANANAACYPFLTQGASNLILSFGNEAIKEKFIPKMYTGEWQGTMALTEPQAGSSLSDIVATAEPQADGTYKIQGQKIYISGGDHEGVENVIHLLLARIKGAPAGTKGISLFVVPKYREENGNLVSNDVQTAGLFGKMGQKGYVAAHLMYGEKDNCYGYLVGEEHRGLSYMFKMMNEARIGTGLVSAGTASAAYYASLEYAKVRPQGRHLSKKDASLPQVLIIEHADVRRMLLYQKAIVEGSIALLIQCSQYADIAHVAEGETKEKAHLMLELLTPIAKSYPSEFGTLSVSTGMQCLGGAGYCDDFPLEQLYRDIRVNSIYEGTTTIHGLDLLGRKVMMEKGRAMKYFLNEVKDCIAEASQIAELQTPAAQLGQAVKSLHAITLELTQLAMQDRPEVFTADATLYLEYFGIVTIGWQWLQQAIKAHQGLQQTEVADEQDFYNGKLAALRYFFEYELPKTLGLHQRLQSKERVTLDTKEAWIN